VSGVWCLTSESGVQKQRPASVAKRGAGKLFDLA